MPLGFSAFHCVATVFCRALNYDTFLKDLSNPRVFTDTDCANVLQNFLRFAVFSRALNYDTEKSALSTFKKLFFVAVCSGVLAKHPLLFSSEALYSNHKFRDCRIFLQIIFISL